MRPGFAGRMSPSSLGKSGVAGAAQVRARDAPLAAGHATRTRVLPTGAAADTGNTTLTAGTAAGATILAAGAAVAVGVAAGTARLLVEDDVRRRCADRTSACFGCGHRHDSHRRRHGPTNNKRFQHIEYGHVKFLPPPHMPKTSLSLVMIHDVDDVAVRCTDEEPS